MSLLQTAISFISITFNLSVTIGNILVNVALYLTINVFYLSTKAIILLKVLLEDFVIFLHEVYHGLDYFYTLTCNTLEIFFHGVMTTYKTSVSIIENIARFTAFHFIQGTRQQVNGMGNMLTELKQLILLIGDGTMFLLKLIPNAILYLIPLTDQLIKEVTAQCCIISIRLKEAFSYYTELFVEYVTDVPVETVMGLIFALLLVYGVYEIYSMLHNYTVNLTNQLVLKVKRRLNQLKNRIKDCLSSSEIKVRVKKTKTMEDSPKINAFETHFCVICQDRARSVLILPCRHLCMCLECSKRMRSYRNTCPICRKRIDSTLQVFT